jgi:hypothetical protein
MGSVCGKEKKKNANKNSENNIEINNNNKKHALKTTGHITSKKIINF